MKIIFHQNDPKWIGGSQIGAKFSIMIIIDEKEHALVSEGTITFTVVHKSERGNNFWQIETAWNSQT